MTISNLAIVDWTSNNVSPSPFQAPLTIGVVASVGTTVTTVDLVDHSVDCDNASLVVLTFGSDPGNQVGRVGDLYWSNGEITESSVNITYSVFGLGVWTGSDGLAYRIWRTMDRKYIGIKSTASTFSFVPYDQKGNSTVIAPLPGTPCISPSAFSTDGFVHDYFVPIGVPMPGFVETKLGARYSMQTCQIAQTTSSSDLVVNNFRWADGTKVTANSIRPGASVYYPSPFDANIKMAAFNAALLTIVGYIDVRDQPNPETVYLLCQLSDNVGFDAPIYAFESFTLMPGGNPGYLGNR